MTSPFGTPDGSRAPLENGEGRFVYLDRRYGAIGRPVDEFTRSRVLVGSQGVGKTLFLRRMHAHYVADSSVDATAPILETSELVTSAVVRFSQMFSKSANSEHWTALWQWSLQLSAARYLLADNSVHGHVPEKTLAELEKVANSLIVPPEYSSAIEIAAYLINGMDGPTSYQRLQEDVRWVRLKALLKAALKNSREIYIFLDAIDDNYRYAPAYWMQCQRGLFYAVMHLLRNETLDDKLHIVISVRDLVFSSVMRSEHAARYHTDDAITLLSWNRESCLLFLNKKLEQLDEECFLDPSQKNVQSFLGRDLIFNERRGVPEDLADYLLRHTRLCPRDLVHLGNDLFQRASSLGIFPYELEESEVRDVVASNSRFFSKGVLSQVASQVQTNAMPWNSSRHDFTESFLDDDEYTADGTVREILSILLTVRAERFGRSELTELEREAVSRFGPNCHFVDTMWQNRLLGIAAPQSGGRYYAGMKDDDTELPMASEYVLNPILLDRLPDLALSEGAPLYPQGSK